MEHASHEDLISGLKELVGQLEGSHLPEDSVAFMRVRDALHIAYTALERIAADMPHASARRSARRDIAREALGRIDKLQALNSRQEDPTNDQ